MHLLHHWLGYAVLYCTYAVNLASMGNAPLFTILRTNGGEVATEVYLRPCVVACAFISGMGRCVAVVVVACRRYSSPNVETSSMELNVLLVLS